MSTTTPADLIGTYGARRFEVVWQGQKHSTHDRYADAWLAASALLRGPEVERWPAGLIVAITRLTAWPSLRAAMLEQWRRDGSQNAWEYFDR